jgi:hypothetical protein
MRGSLRGSVMPGAGKLGLAGERRRRTIMKQESDLKASGLAAAVGGGPIRGAVISREAVTVDDASLQITTASGVGWVCDINILDVKTYRRP